MGKEKRDRKVTIRLTAPEKRNIQYCASRLGMTQTEVLVKGAEVLRGIIDRQREKMRQG